jgi:hypothetical protein
MSDHGDHHDGSDSASDEAIWFSFVCMGLAMAASYKHPSVGMHFVLLVMICWFVWSLWKRTADRFY